MTTSADTPEDVAEDIEELLTWIDEGEFGGSTAGGGVGTEWARESWQCPSGDFLPSPEVTANTGILDDTEDMDELLAWINNGEFGSSTAAGGLSAPSGSGKAGIAPLGIASVFQKRDPAPAVLLTICKLTISSPGLMVSWWSAHMTGGCPHRAGGRKAAIIILGDVLLFQKRRVLWTAAKGKS